MPTPSPARAALAATTFLAAFAMPAIANTVVKDNLNAADLMFRSNMDGCSNVAIAVLAANNPAVYGPTSPNLKREVASYAQKCGLRY